MQAGRVRGRRRPHRSGASDIGAAPWSRRQAHRLGEGRRGRAGRLGRPRWLGRRRRVRRPRGHRIAGHSRLRPGAEGRDARPRDAWPCHRGPRAALAGGRGRALGLEGCGRRHALRAFRKPAGQIAGHEGSRPSRGGTPTDAAVQRKRTTRCATGAASAAHERTSRASRVVVSCPRWQGKEWQVGEAGVKLARVSGASHIVREWLVCKEVI